MKIIRYKYQRDNIDSFSFNKTDFDWIYLKNTNLFVGKNASGKTTLSNVLMMFQNIFLPSNVHFYDKLWIDLINDNGDIFNYSVSYRNSGVLSEKLHINGKLMLNRENDNAKIYSFIQSDFIEVNPPNTNTLIQVRRDEKEYPYFEELAKWARGFCLIKFADAHPYSMLFGNHSDTNADINKALDSLSNTEKHNIITDFNSLGYDVRVINIEKVRDQNFLYVQEGSLKHSIRQHLLSQGMFRSLLILIYLYYLIEKQKATLIIIDDLCEGLDYDRASSLGKLIFKKMEESNVQFIATSNDSFLMNTVDINNWNVIERKGATIKTYNYHNNKELFDEFKFTGLNNFQLFASDYLINPH